MSTLHLRAAGMTHHIEGLDASGLDAAALFRALADRFGRAVAPVGGANPAAPDDLILDRKAASWNDLKAWLDAYVRGLGHTSTAWVDSGIAGNATLHFDHEPSPGPTPPGDAGRP